MIKNQVPACQACRGGKVGVDVWAESGGPTGLVLQGGWSNFLGGDQVRLCAGSCWHAAETKGRAWAGRSWSFEGGRPDSSLARSLTRRAAEMTEFSLGSRSPAASGGGFKHLELLNGLMACLLHATRLC